MNTVRTTDIDMQDTCGPKMIKNIVSHVGWAMCSTYHTLIGSSPSSVFLRRDMLFDIPYIADWADMGKQRQQEGDKSSAIENKHRLSYDYKVDDTVLIVKEGIIRTVERLNEGPYTITQVHTSGTVRIQRGEISERLHIQRLHPYFER